MANPAVQNATIEPFVHGLLDRAVGLRLRSLFVEARPGVLYDLSNRQGVSVIALRTVSLTTEELTTVLTYRLAQYLSAGLVDPQMVARSRMYQDPTSALSSSDIHIVAGSRETGQIFCYSTLRAVDCAPSATTTLRECNRPLFPVEESFRWGVFNDLHTLRDLPITRIVELSRFARNHHRSVGRESGVRGSVEVCVAIQRILCYSASRDYDGVIGDVEDSGAKRNLDFFHTPCVVIRDIAPPAPDNGFLGWASRTRRFLPFAFLVADLALQKERLRGIERALDLPGEQGIKALSALKRNIVVPESSMSREPPLPLGQPAKRRR